MTTSPIPSVKRYMTPLPFTVSPDETLASAHRELRKHHVRHLPVVDRAGALVGIVTERDLHLVETLPGVRQEEVTVDEVMTPRPFQTTPDAPMDQVVAEMAAHKYGAAIVVEAGRVVGILTAIDALGAFVDVLHARAKTG